MVFPKASDVNMLEMNVCHPAVVTALPWRGGVLPSAHHVGDLYTMSLSSPGRVQNISVKLDGEKDAPGALELAFCWRRQKEACVRLLGWGPLGTGTGATSLPLPTPPAEEVRA